MTRYLLAALALMGCACGAQPGSPDGGAQDGGPCDAPTQTGCAAGLKCTIRPDNGLQVCGPAGSALAYAPCTLDAECIGGTACLNVPSGAAGYELGQRCRPVCDPTLMAHLACALGGTCELVDHFDSTVGFCVRTLGADGGP